MKAVKFPQTDNFYAVLFHAAGFTFSLGKLLFPRP